MTQAVFGLPSVRTTDAQLQPWKQSLIDERGELYTRLLKLREFLATPTVQLPDVERQDLNDQATHMGGYLTILDRRIARHGL
jgi:hypothetical protein